MLGERTSKLHLPATKVVDGTISDFVLGERTSTLHLPATKVVDGTVFDFVLGERTSTLHLPQKNKEYYFKSWMCHFSGPGEIRTQFGHLACDALCY